jgi:hypothetical protein
MTNPTSKETLINAGQWQKLLYAYGIQQLSAELEIREKTEVFETCAQIKTVIDSHNRLVNDCLPTRCW